MVLRGVYERYSKDASQTTGQVNRLSKITRLYHKAVPPVNCRWLVNSHLILPAAEYEEDSLYHIPIRLVYAGHALTAPDFMMLVVK
ncbi:hypothetical protein J6590_046418 [Homalodisca vitripennis]|nr:hypothetical protein J6590_046418 [Homalodisca vitripennis]